MCENQQMEKKGYTIRKAVKGDAEAYYEQNFNPLDKEVARLTVTKKVFTKEEVVSAFIRFVEDEERTFFLIIAPDGRIIGESVINELDFEMRCANFRIAIFDKDEWGKGIGTWAVEVTRDYAFEVLHLHRLALSVFSFNPRAKRVYEKVGFQVEGVLRDAVLEDGCYADEILMAILEDEWRSLLGK